MPWRRLIALSLLVVLLAGPAGAGTAEQVGATFGLLIQDVVSAFPHSLVSAMHPCTLYT